MSVSLCFRGAFLCCDESKSELVRDLDDRTQSQNVPYGTSDDLYIRWESIPQLI